MKRELLFRCWDGKKMLKHHEINFSWLQAGDFGDWEVMQFTGLLDKNKVRIYEGDILMWIKTKKPKGKKLYYPVFFSEKGEWRIHDKGTDRRLCDVTNHEVIGNIYNNPELLK